MPDTLRAAIERSAPDIKRGSLAFFGVIFGGRVDNIHTITSVVTNDDGSTSIAYDGGELLTVWDPEEFEVSSSTFEIARASRVLWQWYHYGREHSAENRCFEDYRVEGRRVRATTSSASGREHLKPSRRQAAVEALWFDLG